MIRKLKWRVENMQDKELYVIAVMRYKETNPNLTDEELFPLDWNLNNNYHLKIEIISEAIRNCVLIKETDLYKNSFAHRCKVLKNNLRNE